ncbi:hypothetical protein THRCLA_22181 [Thraustotheca clavata]|uniref:peptidylprolyl isomerase n=1 Tax=Thraustotheca clavata TaxID=74557 RepID=A0A1V9ZAU3_9STRA|nr:hypothetical protein THRCLA_22181 [Thraustotheca clavata]
MKTLRDGVMIEDVVIGQGKVANKGLKIQILYKATLASNGKEFEAKMDRKNPFGLRLGIGNSIQGLDIGIEGMCVGGKRIISIPSKVGFGEKGNGQKVPPNADLIYEVELVKVR